MLLIAYKMTANWSPKERKHLFSGSQSFFIPGRL